MARLARIVAAGYPHHVIQRGNRRQNVFLSERDKQFYLDTLKTQAKINGLVIWAYCLMENHVHLVVVPRDENSLSKTMGETHKRYTRMINFREKWRGYLWEGRFKSFVMDDHYLRTVVRYVENNPVRAGMVEKAQDYPWSSAKAHAMNKTDDIIERCFLSDEIIDWGKYLAKDYIDEVKIIRQNINVGRPLGGQSFIDKIGIILKREVAKRKPGPKGKDGNYVSDENFIEDRVN
ncbi:MAG: transposase [Candidatus Omnitrophica bacterium]|nr:transposase [Candidatus Omnitrophota bacterium]